MSQSTQYRQLSFIRSFLLNQARTHDQIHQILSLFHDNKTSEFMILRLKEGGMKTRNHLSRSIINKSSLPLPMKFLFPNGEKGFAMEKGKTIVNMFKADC
jgi:hypothetical protein